MVYAVADAEIERMDLMTGPTEWTKLKCTSCGSIYFYERIHIINRQGGGTTRQEAGYACRQCNADVDVALMIQRREVERKKAELKALQDEIEPQPEPVPSGKPAKA